jgi:hypothetical protein
MFKLTDLPDQAAVDEIRSIERDLQELKAAQRVGSSSLVIQHNQTGSTWDIDETVLAGLTFVRWRVTFTPDHGGTPHAELGFNYQLTPPDSFSTFEAYADPAYVAGGGIAWLLSFVNNNLSSDVDVKIKCGIKCVDSGTLSLARVFEA